jgi:hypothetical protein
MRAAVTETLSGLHSPQMASRVLTYLRLGWRVVTELSTIYTLYGICGVLLPTGLITWALAFYGEHSAAMLTMAFAVCLVAFTAALLVMLGYRREVNDASRFRNLPIHAPEEVPARAEPRFITVAETVRYIADQSEWGVLLRSAPPDSRGLRPQPRYAAVDELVRVARTGELTVWGRLNRTGEHKVISQQYWQYATIDMRTIFNGGQNNSTSPTSASLVEREQFSYYDGLLVDKSRVCRIWPKLAIK